MGMEEKHELLNEIVNKDNPCWINDTHMHRQMDCAKLEVATNKKDQMKPSHPHISNGIFNKYRTITAHTSPSSHL